VSIDGLGGGLENQISRKQATMMRRGIQRSWRGPVAASLIVHGLLVAAFALLPGFRNEPADSGPAIDTRLYEKDVTVYGIDIDLEPPQTRRATPAVAAPQQLAGSAEESSQIPLVDGVPPALVSGNPTGAAGNPGGEGSEGPLFDVPVQARSVVFVIDRSGSMGAFGRLDRARRELARSLERLPESTRFQVILYNRRADLLRIAGQTGLVPATAENKRLAVRLLDDVVPEGSTDHLNALRQAILLQAEAVYFLTDADDLQADHVRALTQLNHGRSAIHTVEMTLENRGKSDMPLQVLARGNRGTYRAVSANSN
jgi:hypothetical protein